MRVFSTTLFQIFCWLSLFIFLISFIVFCWIINILYIFLSLLWFVNHRLPFYSFGEYPYISKMHTKNNFAFLHIYEDTFTGHLILANMWLLFSRNLAFLFNTKSKISKIKFTGLFYKLRFPWFDFDSCFGSDFFLIYCLHHFLLQRHLADKFSLHVQMCPYFALAVEYY